MADVIERESKFVQVHSHVTMGQNINITLLLTMCAKTYTRGPKDYPFKRNLVSRERCSAARRSRDTRFPEIAKNT